MKEELTRTYKTVRQAAEDLSGIAENNDEALSCYTTGNVRVTFELERSD